MLYGHGNELFEFGSEVTADFSSNIWYKGPPTELLDELNKAIPDVNNYPEVDALSLRTRIAAHHHLEADNVIVTNGSTEAFYLVAHAFKGAASVIIYPCFSEYADACTLYDHSISYVENTPVWPRKSFEKQLVWSANPNNPDGKTISPEDLECLLKNNPSATFILDEAYIDLCYAAETAVPLLSEYDNLVIIRSFTKTFSIPGLRLGYILSSVNNIYRLLPFLLPWSVNSLAIAAGKEIMGHYQEWSPDKDLIREESLEFQNDLKKIDRLNVFPSDCNFFLVQSLHKTAFQLKQFLLKEHGMLIRDASNFRGLDPSFFRVAIQKPEMNRLLAEGIKKWMQI